MDRQKLWSRRAVLEAAGAGAVGTWTASCLKAESPAAEPHKIQGNIKQSICRWCYNHTELATLEKLAEAAVRIGYKSIELLRPEEYKVIKPYGLTCAMLACSSIPEGLNRKENHERIARELRDHILFAAAEGLPNVICMAGNRRGMADEAGLENCVRGLKRVVGLAEQKQVTICMEGLNSKVDHKDYMYDHTRWGIELVRRVGSPRFKLLYDIYHMQIMEGDVIRTIREAHACIAHYHTGGVPGRHEIDQTQELYYPAIVKAILATGYQGYLGQEFVPRHPEEALASLAQGFRICDV